jgi:CBS domain-containing protein
LDERQHEQAHAQLSLLKMLHARRSIVSSIEYFHLRQGNWMNAYELCQRHVVTVRQHEELTTAARTMRERNVGCLVVVEPAGAMGGERPIGMLTDRDIVTKVIARHGDPRSASVDDAMTRQPVTVWASATIEDALRCMRNGGVRRVPIVDDRGRLVGILALDDIFEHLDGRSSNAVIPIRPKTRSARKNGHRQNLNPAP